MIVVTAPTSSIGRQLLQNLLDGPEPLRVIARDPTRLPAATREKVDIVQGSHGDRDVVDRAFKGASSVFWLVPPNALATNVNAAYVDFSRPACEAIRKQGVEHVVGISALGRGVATNAGLVSASLAMDDLIASTGVNYRALTMPSFMDNLLRQVAPIKSGGTFSGPIIANLKLPTCATRDIAAVAAQLLRDRSWSGIDSVAVLGPEDLSYNDMAQIMSEVLGKPVRYEQITGEAFKSGLTGRGMTDAMAQATLEMYLAKNNSIDKSVPRTPETTTPTSFRQWCEEVLEPALAA